MSEITNRPAAGPKIIAYLGNPLAINFPFSGEGFDLSEESLTVSLQKDGVPTSTQPAVSVSGQTASVSLTAGQIEYLPRQTSLLLMLGGVVFMICKVEITTSSASEPIGTTSVSVIAGGGPVSVSVSIPNTGSIASLTATVATQAAMITSMLSLIAAINEKLDNQDAG